MTDKKPREFKDPQDLLKEQNTDAYQWAGSFMNITKGKVDMDDMIGWFANAIMVQHDKTHSAVESRDAIIKELIEALEFYARNEGLRINFKTSMFESCDSFDSKDFHGATAREALNSPLLKDWRGE